jgi:hypothetical protein
MDQSEALPESGSESESESERDIPWQATVTTRRR